MAEKDNEKKHVKITEEELKKIYKSKLELIKQRYGIEFHIEYFDDNTINKIKFTNLNYNNISKNISLIYDNKIKRINYIFYDFDNSSEKNISGRKLIIELNKEKKLKLAINEILKLNQEYIIELKKANKKKLDNSEELELKKTLKNTQ